MCTCRCEWVCGCVGGCTCVSVGVGGCTYTCIHVYVSASVYMLTSLGPLYIHPSCILSLPVMLQPSLDLSSVDKSKHKFMVQSMFAPPDYATDNLDQLVGDFACILPPSCMSPIYMYMYIHAICKVKQQLRMVLFGVLCISRCSTLLHTCTMYMCVLNVHESLPVVSRTA